MTALLVLLFAVASVVGGSDRVGGPFFISGQEVLSSAFW